MKGPVAIISKLNIKCLCHSERENINKHYNYQVKLLNELLQKQPTFFKTPLGHRIFKSKLLFRESAADKELINTRKVNLASLSVPHLAHVGVDAVGVVGPGTGGAVDQVGSLLVSADQAVSGPRGLVDALVAIPGGQK